IGRVKRPDRLFPAVAVHEIVPIRNDVVDRATGMAERNAAIHAAGCLRLYFFIREFVIDLEPIVDALGYRPPRGGFTRVFEKSSKLNHGPPPPPRRVAGVARECTRSGRAGCPTRV